MLFKLWRNFPPSSLLESIFIPTCTWVWEKGWCYINMFLMVLEQFLLTQRYLYEWWTYNINILYIIFMIHVLIIREYQDINVIKNNLKHQKEGFIHSLHTGRLGWNGCATPPSSPQVLAGIIHSHQLTSSGSNSIITNYAQWLPSSASLGSDASFNGNNSLLQK